MTNDGGVGARAAREAALVTDGGLNVADGSSLGNVANGDDVAGSDGGLATSEDVLAGVGTLSGQEVLGLLLIFVGIAEVDLQHGASTAGVVKHSANNSSNVTLTFREVQVAVSWRCDSLALGGGVNAALLTLSLAYVNLDSYIE